MILLLCWPRLFLTDDYRAGSVMLLMVILGVVLRFVQEARADSRRRQAPGDDQRQRDRPSATADQEMYRSRSWFPATWSNSRPGT